jgi:hypothetical protein
MKSSCGSELRQGRGVPSAPGRCMSPALALRSIGRSRPKSKTFSCVRTTLGRAVAGAGRFGDGWIICSPGGRYLLTGSGTSANGSTIGTHPPIGPNSTEGARTIPDIARPHIGGHGAPDSKRSGSVTSGTQARQMRDTPVTAGKRRTLNTDDAPSVRSTKD